jgi:hypothetical protein
MRKSMFASFAALVLGASLALTGCKVGDDGGGDTGGDDNPGNDEGDDDNDRPDAGGGGGEPCPPSVEDFETDVFDVALTNCVSCHGGAGTGFNLSATDMAANLTAATNKAKVADKNSVLLLTKATGTSTETHGGGPQITAGSAQYTALETFVGQVTGADGACD